MGEGWNTSAGLDRALQEMPWMYHQRIKANMGPEWTHPENDTVRLVAHHTPVDFIYVPGNPLALLACYPP